MTAEVEAVPANEFADWLEREAEAQEAGESDLGEQTYVAACAKCHGLAGAGGIGPPLAGSALAADPELAEQIVRNGRGEMPPVGKDWEERQMTALTEYLQEGLGSGG
jgi:mono/diheme cytochrome c family protein